MAHKRTKPKSFNWSRYWKVSFVYFVVFVMIVSLIDYYAMMAFNFLWLLALSAVTALIVGYVHVKSGKKDHVDEVAEELL
ncbi:hypothetical protein [Nitratifractor sp.]